MTACVSVCSFLPHVLCLESLLLMSIFDAFRLSIVIMILEMFRYGPEIILFHEYFFVLYLHVCG